MAAIVWSACGKTEVIGMCQVGGWWDLPLILLLTPYWWDRGILNEMAWLTLGPPSDPLSRFPLWGGWSNILHASGDTDEGDSLGPPSTEGWQFFWPWHWMASDMMDRHGNTSHIQDPTCNALSSGGWWWCPCFDLLFHTRGSELHH